MNLRSQARTEPSTEELRPGRAVPWILKGAFTIVPMPPMTGGLEQIPQSFPLQVVKVTFYRIYQDKGRLILRDCRTMARTPIPTPVTMVETKVHHQALPTVGIDVQPV